jgi:hypothetical protein
VDLAEALLFDMIKWTYREPDADLSPAPVGMLKDALLDAGREDLPPLVDAILSHPYPYPREGADGQPFLPGFSAFGLKVDHTHDPAGRTLTVSVGPDLPSAQGGVVTRPLAIHERPGHVFLYHVWGGGDYDRVTEEGVGQAVARAVRWVMLVWAVAGCSPWELAARVARQLRKDRTP